jgi:arginine decarboxylase
MRAPILQPRVVATTRDPCREDSTPGEFEVHNGELFWNGVGLMEIVALYGTPLKLTFLPKITYQVQHAKSMFSRAMERYNYQGSYTYCYCTKTSHFRFVLDEVLKSNDVHIEISSAFDVPIVRRLLSTGKISKNTHIISNGHKQLEYTRELVKLMDEGFNVLPILDSLEEIHAYEQIRARKILVGIRVATNENSSRPYNTSRLGIRSEDVDTLYHTKIEHSTKFRLKMLHFFVDSGIRDTPFYWNELARFVHKYCELRKICRDLDSIDIGGGFPVADTLDFSFEYEGIIDQIIRTIAHTCARNNVPVPHLFTEFGTYTVGESAATIYKVIAQKQQHDKELWYMIDGSLITQLPEIWGAQKQFITLAINNRNKEHHKVLLGGVTCDSGDFYPDGPSSSGIYLPRFDEAKEEQFVGFFHTGAYQEALGGYGGISHCLIPAPQHVLVDKDAGGNWTSRIFAPKQDSTDMMRFLGYSSPGTTA